MRNSKEVWMRRMVMIALLVPALTLAAMPQKIGGDVKAPTAVRRVEPLYPDEAKTRHISGNVVLEAVIDKTGIVRDVKVVKGLPFGLSESAMDALRQWKFQPATKEGEPVEVKCNMTFAFRL
jgi:TonB family protein